jgi:hypothetical protein
MPRLLAFLVAAAMLAIPASAAAHEPRYTTPTATETVSGSCPVESPCRLDHAVNGASSGDTVHVAPGTYTVQTPLELVAGATIEGDPGDPAPLLVAAEDLAEEILGSAGTVRHLDFRSLAPGQEAVKLTGGIGEDLTSVADGNAFKLEGNLDGVTLLRDSVAQSVSGSGVRMKDGGIVESVLGALAPGPGDVALRNVTALSSNDDAIRCDLELGRGTLVNVIARGPKDVNANNGPGCSASYSSLRPDRSNLTLGEGIRTGDPLFIPGSVRPMAASPTVDAGTKDDLVSAADSDGRERTVPDIGAYECCAPGAWPIVDSPQAPAATTVLVPEPEVVTAKLGSAVVVAPATGRVRVRVPGGHFVDLDAPMQLPVGTVVDASAGRITLVSALDRSGRTQKGRFWGGRFRISQGFKQRGMTTLTLQGGDFSSCGGKLASAAGKRKRPVRSLWSRDKGGRFRTHGHNSVATARGTSWLTRDTCAGTLTRVFKDAVAVRDLRAKRTVLVRAGHKYLARR